MPTIKDVAREVGVSIATVSYVLNGKVAAVSEETRQEVWDAVERIGYTPNITARNLRSNQSRLIGYAWHPLVQEQVNPVLDRFIYYLARAAEKAGYHMLTFTHVEDDPLPVYEDLIRSGRVDGFVVGSTVQDDPRIRFLLDQKVPFVAFGRSNPEWDFAWVDTDGAAGIRMAVEHLLARGHRRIALAAWPQESLSGSFRAAGYCEALTNAGIQINPNYIVHGEHSETTGREALRHWMRMSPHMRPTAVVAVSDLLAIGVMLEAEQCGLVVGRDLSIVGFDDTPMSEYLRPALTTLRQPIPQIGEALVALLGDLLSKTTPVTRQLLLPPDLMERASVGKPPV